MARVNNYIKDYYNKNYLQVVSGFRSISDRKFSFSASNWRHVIIIFLKMYFWTKLLSGKDTNNLFIKAIYS